MLLYTKNVLCFKKLTCRIRCYSFTNRDYKEVSIKVPWGQIAGKWWQPYDVRPVLSLHGWQDSCGSFDRLIPLLNRDVGFLTIDLPGHGYSSRLPLGAPYFNLMYQLTIQSVMDYFKWPKVSLMGHSLGGITSYVFAMIFTKKVDLLICFDGATPLVARDKLARLSKHYDLFGKYNLLASSTVEPPSYSLEEIIQKFCTATQQSVMPEYAKHILCRNIAPSQSHEGKYYLARDPRLKIHGLIRFCQSDFVQTAKSMTLPMFITKSHGGNSLINQNFHAVLENLQKTSVDCAFHCVEGTHHMHLNDPENLVELLNDFLTKHVAKDRATRSIIDTTVYKRNNPMIVFNKFYFARDPRLKSDDLIGLCQSDLVQSAQSMTIPMFLTKSAGSISLNNQSFNEILEVLKKTSIDCAFHYLHGTHHMHLNNPENVAEILNDFLTKHVIEDRATGDITDDIVYKRNNPLRVFSE